DELAQVADRLALLAVLVDLLVVDRDDERRCARRLVGDHRDIDVGEAADDLHALVLERLGQGTDAQPAGRIGLPVLVDDDYRETELHRGSCLLVAQSAQLITIARILRPAGISRAPAGRRRWPRQAPRRGRSRPAARANARPRACGPPGPRRH